MKRTKQEEKFKHLLRLSRERKNLKGVRQLEWVPVEKPQFLGWDIQIVLGESGMRRRDAEELIQIMHIAGISQSCFTRYPNIPKLVKAAGSNYIRSIDIFKRHYKRFFSYAWFDYHYMSRYYLPYYGGNKITEQYHNTLPSNIQRYFSKSVERATLWRPEYNYYMLNQHAFPTYELALKVTRSYSTHRGIPYSEDITRDHEISSIFEREGYYKATKYGYGKHQTWWHKIQNRVKRKSWNQGLNVLSKRYLHGEYAEDVIEYTEKVVSSRAAFDRW